jgi:carbon storage regulator
MLVLSRKFGEQIVIPGCGLTITVVAVDRKTVRLGISAPANVEIYREEVWRRLIRPLESYGEEIEQQDGGQYERH